MSVKHTVLPRWATNDVIDATTLLNNVIEPAEGKKDVGWNYLEKPSRQYFNWLGRQTNQWLEYLDEALNIFAPYETDPATMAISLNAGRINQGTDVLEVATQDTGVMTAPVTNPRIDRVVISETTGLASIVAGSEAASPIAPVFDRDSTPIAQILLYVGMTEIVNADITDERASSPFTGQLAEDLYLTKTTSANIGAYFQNSTTGSTAADGFLVGIDADEKALLWNYENTELLIAVNNALVGKVANDGKWLITPSGGDIVAPSHELVIYNSATASDCYMQFLNDTTGVGSNDGFMIGIAPDNNAWILNQENTSILFHTNGSTIGKLDSSGNWLITPEGNDLAPSWPLVIRGGTTSYLQLINDTTGTSLGNGLLLGVDSSNIAHITNREDTATAFETNNLEIMRLGHSANDAEVLSIGKSSFEDWSSSFSTIQIGGNGSFMSSQSEGASKVLDIIQNAYFDGVWKYISTDEASYNRQKSGVHQWLSAASGTADTAITFTEVMRAGISSSGAEVLSVGKESFENWGGAYSALQIGGNFSIFHDQAEGAGKVARLIQNGYLDGTTTWRYISTDEASYVQQGGGEHRWFTAASGTAGSVITWTEVMRTTSGGDLLIGKTAAVNISVAGHELQKDGQAYHTVSSNTPLRLNRKTDDGRILSFYQDGTEEGYINISGTNCTLVNPSDYRLKDEITPLINGLDRTNLLKPSNYRLKKNGEYKDGFIAHELAEIVPSATIGEKDAIDENGDPIMQGIATTQLIPIMVAAIQEMSAKIETLENR